MILLSASVCLCVLAFLLLGFEFFIFACFIRFVILSCFCYFQFISGESPIQYLRLAIASSHVPNKICFVLKESKSNNWFKHENRDFEVQIPKHPNYEKESKRREQEEQVRRLKEEENRKQREKDWNEAIQRFRSEREKRKLESDVVYKTVELSDDAGDVDISASFNESESIIYVR